MKVHLAGELSLQNELAMYNIGIRYRLNSFYYIKKKWVGAKVMSMYKHTIIDSGLFTMMFGATSHIGITPESLDIYKEQYISFIKSIPYKNFTYVELDVQKKMSSEDAWEYRREFRKRLPDKLIMNVYHLEDGNPDKLIDFSDYISVGMLELKQELSVKERESIVSYIINKAQSKGKKVHILEMSGRKYMRMWRRADTCDSTNWIWYGRSNPYKEHLIKSFGMDYTAQQSIALGNETEFKLSVITSLKQYMKYGGNQG